MSWIQEFGEDRNLENKGIWRRYRNLENTGIWKYESFDAGTAKPPGACQQLAVVTQQGDPRMAWTFLLLVASAQAWQCPQVNCSGWAQDFNSRINGIYVANTHARTAPPWTYTQTANPGFHLIFSIHHNNAWMVKDQLDTASSQGIYGYVRPALASYPEDIDVQAAEEGAWLVQSGGGGVQSGFVASGFTCSCFLGPPSLPPSPPPPPPSPPAPPLPPPEQPPPQTPQQPQQPPVSPPTSPPPPFLPLPTPPSPNEPPPPPSPSPPPPEPPSPPGGCMADPDGRCCV